MSPGVALVLAGTPGMGMTVDHRLLDHGLAVRITARKIDRLGHARASRGAVDRLLTVIGRSDDTDHRREATDRVVECLGQLDVLVDAAGVDPVLADLVNLGIGTAEEIMGVNPNGALGRAREMLGVRDEQPVDGTGIVASQVVEEVSWVTGVCLVLDDGLSRMGRVA